MFLIYLLLKKAHEGTKNLSNCHVFQKIFAEIGLQESKKGVIRPKSEAEQALFWYLCS